MRNTTGDPETQSAYETLPFRNPHASDALSNPFEFFSTRSRVGRFAPSLRLLVRMQSPRTPDAPLCEMPVSCPVGQKQSVWTTPEYAKAGGKMSLSVLMPRLARPRFLPTCAVSRESPTPSELHTGIPPHRSIHGSCPRPDRPIPKI